MRVVAWVLALGLVGCAIEDGLVPCGELACPGSVRCVADTYCATGDQLAACEGVADGQSCVSPSGRGYCDLGVCVPSACGNGQLDALEACDDGNESGGDGCSADCLKVEVCGDAIVDVGEGCDDGNANPSDGCDGCQETVWATSVPIGGSVFALESVIQARAVALDLDGNAFIVGGGRIMRVDRSGVLTHVAGTGATSFSGDGGPATSAGIGATALTVDGLGNIYFVEESGHRVRKIDQAGIIRTIAGTGSAGFGGDGGSAASAVLSSPAGIAVDGLGDVYVADTGNRRVRRIDVSGTIETIAGTGVAGTAGDGMPATSAQLLIPGGLALDREGRLLILDADRIRRIDASGMITTVAGGGVGTATEVPATSVAIRPTGIGTDGAGNIYIAEGGVSGIGDVLRVDATGTVHAFAGTGEYGFSGDGGPATAATFRFPDAVAADAFGNVFIADQRNHRLRRVDENGIIETVAGNGLQFSTGDGGSALSVTLGAPAGLAFAAGMLYVADMFQERIRRIDARGVISTFAGSGERGTMGDGGPATSAMLSGVQGVAVDATGVVYIADTYNCRIRKVDAAGTITTIAGDPEGCYSAGDGGPALAARLDYPEAVAVDAQGRLLIADTGGNRIRRIEADGTITAIAGTGDCSPSGDGGPATAATLCGPSALAVSGDAIYIAEVFNAAIRKIDGAGTITTVAGPGFGFGGDGGPATSALMRYPSGVAVASDGTVYIADTDNHRVRRVATTGTITTIAGNGTAGFAGDGGPATSAQLRAPRGLALDASGRLDIAEDNERVRRIELDGTISTVAGPIDAEGMGPPAVGRLTDPRAMTIAPGITFFAGGSSGTVQASTSDWLEVVAGRYPQAAPGSTRARFQQVFGEVGGVAYDATTRTLYVTETNANRIHAIAVVDLADETTWTIAAFANTAGTAGFADGALGEARFRRPTGLFLDEAARQLYVADTGNHVIRAIDLNTNAVRTVVGTPQQRGFFGDGGDARSALLFEPTAITRCATGDLFVADTANHRVRRIAASDATISTVVGVGVAASSGEGTPASAFPVNAPKGLACDAYSNLFVTSTTTVRVLAADANGIVDGTGAARTIYGAPPRTQFPASATRCLTGLGVAVDGVVQAVDSCSGILVELRRMEIQ